MAIFSYSFCMAMLHSLWQSTLLMLLYQVAARTLLQIDSPLVKRNFLFTILTSQVALSGFTFWIYFSGDPFVYTYSAFTRNLSAFVQNDTLHTMAPWLFLAYMIVIGYKLAKTIYTWVQFKQQFKLGLQKPPVELKLFTELRSYQFGIRRKIRIWLSTTIHTPVTFGFFKPVIILPVALVNHISIRQAETLIIHELTHIRTNDYLLNWFLLFAETVFFFNPFVRNFCSKVRMEREKNCDMGVIAFEYSPVLYAETLLQAEKMKQLVPGFHLAAVNRKRQLLDRIRFFSGNIDFKQPVRLNKIVPLMGLFLLLFFSSLMILSPSRSNTDPSQESTAVPYLPFSNIEVPPVYEVNGVIDANEIKLRTRELHEQVVAAAESIDRQPGQLTAESEKEANAIIDLEKQMEQSLIVPVTVTENDASKQIIIQEESSGSSKSASMKTYSLRFENGQWVLEPVWNILAREIPEDSLLKKMDSSNGRLKRAIPPQQ